MENRGGVLQTLPALSRSVEGVECHGEQAGDAKAAPFTARPVEEKPLSLPSYVSHAAIGSHFLNRAPCFRVLLQPIPVRLHAVFQIYGASELCRRPDRPGYPRLYWKILFCGGFPQVPKSSFAFSS